MGFYKFAPEDAERFAQERGIKAIRRRDELVFTICPYCGEKSNDKEKFSINLTTGQFNCFRASCGRKGNMITIAQDFDFSLGTQVDEYYRPTRRFRKMKQIEKPVPKPFAVEWLKSRGVSENVANKYHITTRTDAPTVIVFPFYDEKGEMQFIKYRNTDEAAIKERGKEWCERDCKPILFGMAQCNLENKTLILTEGQIDSLSVAEAGIENAVSVPTGANGFTWVPYCWDFLKKFETLIVFGDHERGKITLLEEMRQRFDGTVKHVREEDYKDVKDANDLLRKYGKDAVRAAVTNAVVVENPKIIPLASVKRVDLSRLEKFSTGLETLDKTLGGFFLGQLVILTGERGEGKSTMASQFATMAVSNGYPVFFYSGELTNGYFKAWFDFQMAGSKYITGNQSKYGIEYHIDANYLPEIERWYSDKIYLYDNTLLEDGDEEEEKLTETIQSAIRQYGCRIVFVDNLMTAVTDDLSSDIYRQQTKFVRELAIMAKRFNVLIFLIAHPKKRNGMEFSNDDVAGSSNVTNLADVVLRYMKPPEDDDSGADRILQVWKNRLTGKTEKKIPLFYEESSRRISEKQKFDWKIGWEKTAGDSGNEMNGYVQMSDDDDIPFD